ncbi:hypothetical protein CDV36_009383 [Fusarium kuroshium]|uniref:Uncharacterized protein n=2 Tax=Fusarium solani species complex TaxID=232080 RepID=A0A3M2S0A0_9HYPO|nr:hypothetical protein CDV36_009383 [Fusarium kuroshium]RSL83914.1 hypothetical protein CEP51_004204 [Fusarium floridanum]
MASDQSAPTMEKLHERLLTMEEMEEADADQEAKRPAGATPATTPPAKRANRNSPLQFKISGLRDAVRDRVSKELSKQLPDLLAENERIQKMEEEMRELREESQQLREESYQLREEFLQLREEFLQLRKESHQLREKMAKDKVA